MLSTLRPGMRGTSVKTLQLELKKLGYFKANATGFYGPITRAAVDAFERAKHLKHDGIADGVTRGLIDKLSKSKPAAPVAAPTWKSIAAPKADYRRVRYDGVTINKRTQEMIGRAQSYLKRMGINAPIHLAQGSYHPGVGASAGTHDGGGVIDVRSRIYSAKTADQIVKALRMAGFAAWRRGTNDSLPPHIHAVAIGDRQMSPSARAQVHEYFRGGDGLRGSMRDVHLTAKGHNIGRPVPNWARSFA